MAADDVVGKITPPDWLTDKWGKDSTTIGPNFGLIIFLSNVLKLLIVLAGLFGLLNLILAGWGYIGSNGEPEKIKAAQAKMLNSLLGLIIIAASFTIAAIIGWILFGDVTMIISPKIYGPGGGT